MRLVVKILTIFIVWISQLPSGSSASINAALSPSIEERIAAGSDPDSIIKIIVFVADDSSRSRLNKISALSQISQSTRHQEVVNLLKLNSASPMVEVKKRLSAIVPNSKITDYWIVEALALEAPLSKIEEISALPQVISVIENAPVEYIQPVQTTPVVAKVQGASSHLAALNIPALWARGLKGRGRLICSFDTGVEGTHPALQSKWRGLHSSLEAAWFAPESNDTIPSDKVGHGTHTMGLMVGSTASDSFGVAPDAEWINAAVIDQGLTLTRTISDILAAFQWAVDPDGNPATDNDVPDVILNSWGIPTSILPACDQTFYQVIDNVEAAGIVTVFAAGNEGPNRMSLRIPANRATTPLNSFSVGAIDDVTNSVAGFSSRGPSSCDTTQVKPEVVAPGVSIYSSYKGGTYRVMSGTSMAAPYIAGLVALLRQYNPDATVAEIKTAIINSARDLGPIGEDNDYGNGLPDAVKAIQFMPIPAKPEVYLAGKIIGGDGIADPGETFDLFVRLNVPSANIDSLTGTIATSDTGINILSNKALFVFEPGIGYSMNIRPISIKYGTGLINGRNINFNLLLDFPYNDDIDTLSLQIMVGRPPVGSTFTHSTPSLKFTVTNFGQLGLGLHSIYSAGGDGFDFNNSGNILYEAGIIVGRNSLQLSSAVRDSLGRADQPDFNPIEQLATNYPSADGGFNSFARFADTRSKIPIPITIDQSTTTYENPGDDGMVIIKYFLVNNSLEIITNLNYGFLTDFDLDPLGDRIGLTSSDNIFYQSGNGRFVGILPLTPAAGIRSLINGSCKLTLTAQQKFDYINSHSVAINDTSASDFMTIHSFGPFTLNPHDSVEVSVALLAGDDLAAIKSAGNRALARYHGMTDVAIDDGLIPNEFELLQNYPNPFNPATTIEFFIPRASKVCLTVFNLLGQEVAQLVNGNVRAGKYEITWNGKDRSGEPAASGIYFYRLQTELRAITRKMVLIK